MTGVCPDRSGAARNYQYEKLYYEFGWNDYYRDSNKVLNTPLTSATCFCVIEEGPEGNRHEQRSIVYTDTQVEG